MPKNKSLLHKRSDSALHPSVSYSGLPKDPIREMREIRASINDSLVSNPENKQASDRSLKFGENEDTLIHESKMLIDLNKTRMSVKSGMKHS
jgi:hypothetical protein